MEKVVLSRDLEKGLDTIAEDFRALARMIKAFELEIISTTLPEEITEGDKSEGEGIRVLVLGELIIKLQ